MDDLDVIGLCLYYDRTLTTYKYSLFFSLVDICKNYPSLPKKISKDKETRVEIPMGIIVWKFIEYYYPYYYQEKSIAIGKKTSPYLEGFFGSSIESDARYYFKNLKYYYGYSNDGLNKLSQEILLSGIPEDRQTVFISLANYIHGIIFDKVMKEFGKSLFKNDYPIFKIESDTTINNNKPRKLDLNYIIYKMGTFSIPVLLYEEICTSSIDTIYEKTRVIENWIKSLINLNDSLSGDVDCILSLIPSISGDEKVHCLEYFKIVVSNLRSRWDLFLPPADLELNNPYETDFNDFEDKNIEESDDDIANKLYSCLNYLNFEPVVSKIISMLYVYGGLSRTEFKTYYKSDELNSYLKDLLNKGTIVEYNKRKGNRYNITCYSLNRDLLLIVNEKVIELNKWYDSMRIAVETIQKPQKPTFYLNNKKTIQNKSKCLSGNEDKQNDSKEDSNHFNDYSIYLEDYPMYPMKKPVESKENNTVVIEENILPKKYTPTDNYILELEKIGFSEKELEILEYIGCNNEATLLDIEKDLYNHQHVTSGILKYIDRLRFSGYIQRKNNKLGNLYVYSLSMPLKELYLNILDTYFKEIQDAEQEIKNIDNKMKLRRSKV